ncbi:hypothetical protein BKI52_39235 [marine bacterium AO1-C]|nr:hypothetical protein BKI52_39235 [marine bacterium AO1-C]
MYADFIVDQIIEESQTIKSFYLKRGDKQPLETYHPGQFITLQIAPGTTGKTYTRNYTLSDSPTKPYYRLTIKKEPEGVVSGFLHSEIQVGDKLQVSKPNGQFYLSNQVQNPILLLSGGVGITPMLSMLEYVVTEQPNRPVYFLHSSSNKEVQPMQARLKELTEQNPYLKVEIYHTKPTAQEVAGTDYDFEGVITLESLKRYAQQTGLETYLCGPVGFMETMYTHLLELGIPTDKIFYEFFGEGKPLGQTPVFKDADTNTFEVSFTKSDKRTRWEGAQTNLLELAEDTGLAPEFGCRMGTCSSCEVSIKKGSVTYDPEPFLEVPEGKVLLCCAQPTSNVEIEI